MSATPFDLRTCPRVPAVTARATRAALAALAAVPARWAVDASPSGRTEVIFEGLAADEADPGDVVLRAVFGTRQARMTVDADFATRVVDAALFGRIAFRSARRLGPVERGIVASVLGSAFQPLGWGIGLGRAPAADGGAARAYFRVEMPAATGRVSLSVPALLTAETSLMADTYKHRARRLSVVSPVQIAATLVAAGEVAALAAGDAVVFDGYPAESFSIEASWPGVLAIGHVDVAHVVPIEIDAAGGIRTTGGFKRRVDALDLRGKETGMDASGITDATAVLAAAPIEVVVEVGRIRLRGDEVLGLATGAVLTLPHGRGRVSLRVAGELLAEGELVDVDGELGVRVTRMAAR